MQLSDQESDLILRTGRNGKPWAEIPPEDLCTAGELIRRGLMFDWWKGLAVSRLTPTIEAFEAATSAAN